MNELYGTAAILGYIAIGSVWGMWIAELADGDEFAFLICALFWPLTMLLFLILYFRRMVWRCIK